MNSKLRQTFLEYLGIILGSAIVSIAFVVFINPYKLVPGGVYGTSIVLHNLFPAIQVGSFSYCIAIPLLILSYLLIGKNIGVRTLVATLVAPFMMNNFTRLLYPTREALQALDPHQLAGGVLDLSDNLILACIFGPILIGVGEALIMKCHATTGGSDIVALLIHKYCRVKFSTALLSVDATVVCFGLVVIGLGIGLDQPNEHSWMLSLYSLICIFLMSRTLAYVITGSKNNKLMFIITQSRGEEMTEFILHKLDRTATVLPSNGLYSGEGHEVLMMVVRRHEVDIVTSTINQIDPHVFVIVTDAYDTFGCRWRNFPDKSDLQLS